MRVLFITSYASPYRVRFFDELGKSCALTVAYTERIEDQKHRDQSWFVAGQGNFSAVQIGGRIPLGRRKAVCLGIGGLLREKYDIILVGGYGKPTLRLALIWLKLHRRPYYMEVDGGRVSADSGLRLRYKRFLVGGAAGYFSTGTHTTDYLCHYGAAPDRIYRYPFASVSEAEIAHSPATNDEKRALRQKLGMTEKYIVLSVGQLIPRKAPDVLIRAAQALRPDTGVYFVGGEPDEEFRRAAAENPNVHFVGFRKSDALAEYYRAADVLAMPTRWDIWGLVVNEAMAAGLPVVSTDACVAGTELVQDGVNGYLVPAEDADTLADRLNAVLDGDLNEMGRASLERIAPYTLENMAKAHMELFTRLDR